MDKSSAILIDAYSQIFRVFYAIAHLSRRDGFPTNALFGFARLLMQLEKDFAPAAGCMFFDCGKPAFRLELAPEYKSNRPPMPEELKLQMPLLREMAGLFGWNICECTNYEADDLIGAAVKNTPEQNFLIISSDKDLSQLIDERTRMLIPARMGSGFTLRGTAETLEKFAVAPTQMVDYLSLLGDASDMISGVPGIGPKTAAAILQSCGSLEKFFADPAMLSNAKQREKLLAAREQLERNRQLITLRTQWPADEIGAVNKYLLKRAPDWQKIARMAQEYELKSVLKELESKLDSPLEPPAADDLFSMNLIAATPEKPVNPPAEAAGKPEQGVLF